MNVSNKSWACKHCSAQGVRLSKIWSIWFQDLFHSYTTPQSAQASEFSTFLANLTASEPGSGACIRLRFLNTTTKQSNPSSTGTARNRDQKHDGDPGSCRWRWTVKLQTMSSHHPSITYLCCCEASIVHLHESASQEQQAVMLRVRGGGSGSKTMTSHQPPLELTKNERWLIPTVLLFGMTLDVGNTKTFALRNSVNGWSFVLTLIIQPYRTRSCKDGGARTRHTSVRMVRRVPEPFSEDTPVSVYGGTGTEYNQSTVTKRVCSINNNANNTISGDDDQTGGRWEAAKRRRD